MITSCCTVIASVMLIHVVSSASVYVLHLVTSISICIWHEGTSVCIWGNRICLCVWFNCICVCIWCHVHASASGEVQIYLSVWCSVYASASSRVCASASGDVSRHSVCLHLVTLADTLCLPLVMSLDTEGSSGPRQTQRDRLVPTRPRERLVPTRWRGSSGHHQTMITQHNLTELSVDLKYN